jgi:hypothetical protein
VVKVELSPGEALLVPPGWAHALASPIASTAMRTRFWHGGSLAAAAQVRGTGTARAGAAGALRGRRSRVRLVCRRGRADGLAARHLHAQVWQMQQQLGRTGGAAAGAAFGGVAGGAGAGAGKSFVLLLWHALERYARVARHLAGLPPPLRRRPAGPQVRAGLRCAALGCAGLRCCWPIHQPLPHQAGPAHTA